MPTQMLRYLVAPLIVFSAAVCVGCSDQAAGLTLTSLREHRKFAETFTNAYATHNDNGDLDVVLVDDATKRSVAAGRPMDPIHQIMHIRVLWHPSRDMKSEDSAASNASIHWYVMGASRGQMIEYTGTAFVYVSDSAWSDRLKLSIENARLKPSITRGDLKDPIGPSRIEGTVYASDNPRIVNRLLGEVRTSVADAK